MTIPAVALYWIAFLVGQGLHWLKRADYCTKSKFNKIETYGQFFRFYWVSLLVRFIICAAGFSLWVSNPQFINKMIAGLGWTIGVEFPVTGGTAVFAGYFSDSITDWIINKIPFLKPADAPAADPTKLPETSL